MSVLNVPYFTQPTSNTCQSTCLKMMATYLDAKLGRRARDRDIHAIWKRINESPSRPSRVRNSYQNFQWWLEQEFPSLTFKLDSTTDPVVAETRVIRSIDAQYPLICSTNHTRTSGHIILIIGYRNECTLEYSRVPSFAERSTVFVCHDPYGKFDPVLSSRVYGTRRFEGGATLADRISEVGPGMYVEYDIEGIRRSRDDRHSYETFFLLRAT